VEGLLVDVSTVKRYCEIEYEALETDVGLRTWI